MRSLAQRLIVVFISLGIGVLSYFLTDKQDFVWSIRIVVIPVLMTMLTLYTTLSMNLVKALDELPKEFREKAMSVLSSIQFELRLELYLLIITLVFLVLYPLLDGCVKMTLFGRCLIDFFIVFDVVNFIIVIIETFNWYLELIKIGH